MRVCFDNLSANIVLESYKSVGGSLVVRWRDEKVKGKRTKRNQRERKEKRRKELNLKFNMFVAMNYINIHKQKATGERNRARGGGN